MEKSGEPALLRLGCGGRNHPTCIYPRRVIGPITGDEPQGRQAAREGAYCSYVTDPRRAV